MSALSELRAMISDGVTPDSPTGRRYALRVTTGIADPELAGDFVQELGDLFMMLEMAPILAAPDDMTRKAILETLDRIESSSQSRD